MPTTQSPGITTLLGGFSGLTTSPEPELFPRPPRHALDDVLDEALEDWQFTPGDDRTEGQVIRATLADPANRWLVTAWLQEAGLS